MISARPSELGRQDDACGLTKRLTIRGFIVSDFAARHGDFLRDMSQWVREGKVKHKEFVTEGLDSAPAAFMGLLKAPISASSSYASVRTRRKPSQHLGEDETWQEFLKARSRS